MFPAVLKFKIEFRHYAGDSGSMYVTLYAEVPGDRWTITQKYLPFEKDASLMLDTSWNHIIDMPNWIILPCPHNLSPMARLIASRP